MKRQMLLSPLQSLPRPHLDDRGGIQDIALVGTDLHLQVITSRAGTVRGDHLHHEGAHSCYVAQGALWYIERISPYSVGEESTADFRYRIEAGQCFFTGPGVAHRMEFVEDTILVVIGDRRRTQEEYEADLERVVFS